MVLVFKPRVKQSEASKAKRHPCSEIASERDGQTRTRTMELPRLPLDIVVPQAVLSRRGGVTISQKILRTFMARQTAEISVDPSVQNAIFIRISEEETAAASSTTAQSLLPPTGHRGSTTTTSTFRRLSDADRLLIEALETGRERTRHTGRFLTMHKRRRKRLTTRSLAQDPGILDDIFHGQVQCVLQKSGSWRFNAFTLETVTGGRSLPVLCVHLFHWYGLLEHFKLDVVRVWKLFNLIEEGYHSTNPYHNSIHATDVTQAMHCFLQEEKIRSNLSPLEIMASLIGAVTHDLDHPGVNQPFLVATRNHLAALYENTSVLENHHWRSAIGCLLESGVSEQLAAEVRPELERHISSLILATDITRQQEFLTRFKRYLDQNLLDMTRSEDRHFILQIALKCADISNPCRPWDISRKWSHKVCEEFFRQGDYERRLNLPVTPLCDRNTTSIPRIQAGFFKLVVTPLYEEWHRFLRTGLSVDLMDYLKGNQSRWEALIQQDAAEETKTEISELEEIDNAVSSEDEGPAEDSGSIELLLPDSSLSRRTSLPVEAEVERVGRRHSVPLSVPKLLPIARTIIRRESLPTEQKKLTKVPHVKLEDQHLLGRDSLSLLSSRSSLHDSTTMNYSTERPVSAENLLPEPSIASITNSAEASRLSTVLQPDQKLPCQTKQLTRQQTFPPLQPYVRMRHMSTTIEMSQCSEALIEADSPSSSTPSPVTETSGSVDPDRAVATESPSRDSSEDSNGRSSSGPSSVVGGTVTKDSDASDGAAMIGRRRGSALPGSIRRPEAASSSEIARRHSMQVPGSLHVVSNLTFPSLPQTSAKDSVSTREDEISSFDIQSRRESVEPDLESPRSTDSKYQQANSKADSTSTTVGDLNTESTISSRVRCHHGSNVSPKHSAFFDETEASDSISDVANEGSCCSQMEYCESASRRFSTPTIDASAKADSAIRRFSAIPVSNESHQHKVFFVGTPPDSPPHVPSGSSDSGSEPRRSISNSTSESVSVGTKRDPDTSRDRGSKIPKLSVEPTMKENVDPRTSDEGKVLPAVKRNSQGWARRRSSAPVGLLSKVDDILALAAVTPRGDQYSRRGSVPTDMTRHQNGGSNRSALCQRGENLSSPRRASLPQETALGSLLDIVFTIPREESNYASNNTSSRINEPPLPTSGMPSLRRGSVPADISELRRDMFNRNSVNGKSRNRKKILYRRSSGGPEMFAGGMDGVDNGAWPKWKRDFVKRDSISEPLVKRRGSLPIDMLTISHVGIVAAPRKSSLWRL